MYAVSMYCRSVCTPFSTAYELQCTRHVFHMNCSCTTKNKSPKLPHTLQVNLFGQKSNLLVCRNTWSHEGIYAKRRLLRTMPQATMCRRNNVTANMEMMSLFECALSDPFSEFSFSMYWRRPFGVSLKLWNQVSHIIEQNCGDIWWLAETLWHATIFPVPVQGMYAHTSRARWIFWSANCIHSISESALRAHTHGHTPICTSCAHLKF